MKAATRGTRARLLLTALVIALGAFTTALAFAQDQGPAEAPAETAEAPAEHAPASTATATATAAPAAHGEAAGAQHGEAAGAQHGEAAGAQHGEHAAGAQHGEHAAGAHHGPEAINWTDIWDSKRPAVLALVINFGILMTLYYMLGKKPISAALKQRRVTIGKDIDEAQKLLDEAKDRAKKYQAELNTADADAATAKAGLISAGKGEVDRLLVEAQERAERMKRDAERLVEQERKQVHQDLLKETVELAVQQASQILEKSVTADDHARLAADLLAELSRRPSAPKKGLAAGSVRPPTGPAGGGAS